MDDGAGIGADFGGRKIAWERDERDPCERLTDGCAILHSAEERLDGDCETW